MNEDVKALPVVAHMRGEPNSFNGYGACHLEDKGAFPVVRQSDAESALAALRQRADTAEAQRAKLRSELVWVLTEVWPLVHGLTRRDCVRERFLKLTELLS